MCDFKTTYPLACGQQAGGAHFSDQDPLTDPADSVVLTGREVAEKFDTDTLPEDTGEIRALFQGRPRQDRILADLVIMDGPDEESGDDEDEPQPIDAMMAEQMGKRGGFRDWE